MANIPVTRFESVASLLLKWRALSLIVLVPNERPQTLPNAGRMDLIDLNVGRCGNHVASVDNRAPDN